MNVPCIDPRKLNEMMKSGEPLTLIDVREPFEREIATIGGENIPVAAVGDRLNEIPRDHPVVIYCRSGGRSGRIVHELISRHGYNNLFNLTGGILQWSDEVDPSIAKY